MDNKEAVILDFFAGSGTTTHAVALMNQEDGGSRVSISVTNNEIGPTQAAALRKKGLRPGDAAWEAQGIYEAVTRPRVTAAITGHRPDGEPVDLNYDSGSPASNGFEENVELLELTYLDADDVQLDLAFEAIAPLLWLRAGARGPVLTRRVDENDVERDYAWTEHYGVLFNPDRWRGFVADRPVSATTALVVTDSQALFAGVAAELPEHLDVVRLYENYLTTFQIGGGLA